MANAYHFEGVAGFLGTYGLLSSFLVGYGTISWPLTQQLKDAFKWKEEVEAAFQKLKATMTTILVLALPNFSLPFLLETDASGTGLGAVLMQNHRPIAYYNHVLSPRNRLRSIYERELMAIVFAIQKWRHYLLGRHFSIHTDQRSLKYLLERVISADYQKWLSKIIGYDFEIRFKPGLENKVADALSRIPSGVEIELATLTFP